MKTPRPSPGFANAKICPRCGSINVEQDRVTSDIGAGLVKYVCRDCGFDGFLFPEVPETMVEDAQKEIARSKAKDNKRK